MTVYLRFAAKSSVLRWSMSPPSLVLLSTIFHPQGGGQPSDVGELRVLHGEKTITFVVSSCKLDKETQEVIHEGSFKEEAWQDGTDLAGDEVEMRVDEEKRRLHARLHSVRGRSREREGADAGGRRVI
eukprot:762924-Hanusia_phi.AAC.5